MSVAVLGVIAALIGGIGYRLRGGYVNTVIGWFKPAHRPFPGVANRVLSWGGALALAAWLGGLAPLWGLLLGLTGWVGCTAGLLHSIDLGRNEDTFWRDLIVLTLRGGVVMAPVTLGLFGLTWLGLPSLYWLPAASGLLEGVLYWLATYCCTPIEGFGRGGDAPEMGEVFVGLAWGAATFLAVAL